MPARYRVALHGFSEFERTTLAYCIHHAAAREPGYVQVERLADCDFIVADASHEPVAESAVRRERMADTLFIGANAPPGASAQLQRPIDPERILRALDRLASERGSGPREVRPGIGYPPIGAQVRVPLLGIDDIVDTTPAAFQHEPGARPFTEPVPLDEAESEASKGLAAQPAARATPLDGAKAKPSPGVAAHTTDNPLPAKAGTASDQASDPPSKRPLPSGPERAAAKAAARRASRNARLKQAAAAAGALRDVLLLDPATGPLGLFALLEAFGFVVHRADGIAQALAVLAATPIAAAFIDDAAEDDAGLDGLAVCRLVKQRQVALAGAVPAVMLVSTRDSAAGRVRAKLAGCDAFLAGPITRGDAARALESCNVPLPTDARRA